MLRVHFTAGDLTRVRVANSPDPLWEVANSVHLLQRRDAMVFDEWRRRVRPRLPQATRLLAPLFPPYGYFPDFLTPVSKADMGLEQRIDLVLGTPHRNLRTDLTRLAATHRSLPQWVRDLADGATQVLHRLGEALRIFHQQVLAPDEPRIRAHVDADRAIRAKTLLDGGTEALLAGLGPAFRWQSPVLEADYPVRQDLHLNGRGLLLQPSFFCWRRPITLVNDSLPPVLVYPIRHAIGWSHNPAAAPSDVPSDPLAALIGRNRAALLKAVHFGATTGELACRLGISAPAVSQHVSVLRKAGLVISVRLANHVLHTLTPEGRNLLLAPGQGGYVPL